MTTAIPPSRISSAFGAQFVFKNLAPGGFALAQRIAVMAQGNTATTYVTTKRQVFSALEAAQVYGFGSPIHAIVSKLLPASGDGVGSIPVTIYPLGDGTTPATGDIAPTGTSTEAGAITVVIGGIRIPIALASGTTVAVAVAAIVAAVNAEINAPVTAVDNASTSADFTAKWGGLTGNQISLSVEGAPAGLTFGVTAMSGGAVDPTIGTTQTDQFGDVHETLVINQLGGTTAALDALSAFNEGRWDALVQKFFLAFYATVETSAATAITVPDARKTDRTNVQLAAPGSPDLPWAIAARMVSYIARVANGASIASDYTRIAVQGITPGSDASQWDAAERETVVRGGSCTSIVRDGVVQLLDTVTMYHPTGDPTPAYRYANDIVKLMNVSTDVRSVFDTNVWLGSPLVPDNQPLANPAAKQPKMAKAELFKLIDYWGRQAIISDPAAAKDTVTAAIDGGNPRRLNLGFTIQVSGNVALVSADMNFGFYFGG